MRVCGQSADGELIGMSWLSQLLSFYKDALILYLTSYQYIILFGKKSGKCGPIDSKEATLFIY